MKLRKVYRFRMRPTKTQEVALYRMAGARRFVYNWALSRRKDHYAEHGKGISARELSSELSALKSKPETLWLQEGRTLHFPYPPARQSRGRQGIRPEGRLDSYPSLQRSRRNDQERHLQERRLRTLVRCPDDRGRDS